MGCYTTFTISNDRARELLTDSARICRELYDHTSSDDGLEGRCGPIKAQTPRHASEHTIYVGFRGPPYEMSRYSKETRKLLENNPEFFKEMLVYMESELKELKSMLKERTKKKK